MSGWNRLHRALCTGGYQPRHNQRPGTKADGDAEKVDESLEIKCDGLNSGQPQPPLSNGAGKKINSCSAPGKFKDSIHEVMEY